MFPREERKLRKALRELSDHVFAFLVCLDEDMKLPSDAGRGRRIAALSNNLEMANDRIRYFSLGLPIDKKGKARTVAKLVKGLG